jgi:Undecaprenyl-phosphate galactose phosphotransferase WbaP
MGGEEMRTTIDVPESVFAYEAFQLKLFPSVLRRYSRWWMTLLLGISDISSLFLAGALAALIRAGMGNGVRSPTYYLKLTPLLLIFVLVYAVRGLYPAVGISPVEELKRLAVSTSMVWVIMMALTFWTRDAESFSRLVFAFIWIFALVFVQVSRWMVRIIAVRLGVWGEPVAVVGFGSQGRVIVEFLNKNYRFGLRPVVIIDGFDKEEARDTELPIIHLGNPEAARQLLQASGIQTAILIAPEVPASLQDEIVDGGRFGFKRLILISDLRWIGSLGVIPYDLEGFLGLEIRQNLFSRRERILKRILDLALVIVLVVVALPLLFLISLLVWLDSPGKVFYTHKRVGIGGRDIKVWKFRTMVPNAEQVLNEYLNSHPELRSEWEATHKLKDDPRVTRIGRILRKLSLDELPQIWNVLKGEMSLVGPRPIVTEEIKRYGQGYKLYQRVRPGLTGLWQVSGRNDVSYETRVRFDKYYVRNWSIWLDIYILLRTIWVVLRSDGAY